MEKNRVKILSVKKNEIIVSVKKSQRKQIVLSILIIFAFVCLGVLNFNNFGTLISNVYNPVNSLYSDNSDIVFTNGALVSDNMSFYVPIVANYKIMQNGVIEFEVNNSIMVKACESGIVDEIGVSNDGIKYIKIKHSETIYSVIENVDIVGVAESTIVKRGQDIATAKLGDRLNFYIVKDGVNIDNIKIESSKIVWQS